MGEKMEDASEEIFAAHRELIEKRVLGLWVDGDGPTGLLVSI